MGAIIGLVLSGIPGVVESVLAYLQKKADVQTSQNATNVAADVQVNLALVQAKLEEQKLIAAQRAADRSSPWTAWMFPAAFAVVLFHFSYVAADSVPWFGNHIVGSWKVAALPGDLNSIEYAAFIAVFGITGGVPALRRIFSK